MLQVHGIGTGAAGYYFEGSRPAGRWIGAGAAALGLDGTVSEDALAGLLQGRDPRTGLFLPRVRAARRRAGWDLIFSAPKSVSLLAAIHPGVDAAHRDALGEALGHLQDRVFGPGRELVGAAFEHRTNAASEPHLHTHVVLANVVRHAGGSWGAAGSTEWWPRRAELSALYQLGLRHHLARAGWELDWRLRPDGLADLADVPRAAVRATSTQTSAVAWSGWYQARNRATPQPWLERAVGAGFDDRPWSPSGGSPGSPALPALGTPDGRALAASLTSRLAARRADFRATDVLVALAATYPKGATAGQAMAWVEGYCQENIPVPRRSPTQSPRWTTTLAQQAERRLLDRAGALDLEVWSSRPGESSLLSHAALLSDRALSWRDVGVRVPSDGAGQRWTALTGVPADRPAGRAGVVVVDQADRLSAGELLAVLDNVRGTAVLLEGGTLPRLSYPNNQLIDSLGQRMCPPAPLDGGPAVAKMIETWLPARETLMVGLGIDETRALNAAARRESTLGGAVFRAGGREFQAGDRVIAMARLAPAVRRGATGEIVDVSDRRRDAIVRWDSGLLTSLDTASGARLGYGYAATPALARWTRGPLLLLGHPDAVPPLRARVIESVVMGSERGRERGLTLSR